MYIDHIPAWEMELKPAWRSQSQRRTGFLAQCESASKIPRGPDGKPNLRTGGDFRGQDSTASDIFVNRFRAKVPSATILLGDGPLQNSVFRISYIEEINYSPTVRCLSPEAIISNNFIILNGLS